MIEPVVLHVPVQFSTNTCVCVCVLPIASSNGPFSTAEHPAELGNFLRNHLTRQKTFSKAASLTDEVRLLSLIDGSWRVCVYGDSLIEGIGQWLQGTDRYQAVVPCGQIGPLPQLVLSCVPHHQKVVLFERQLFFIIFILLTSCIQGFCKEGS